jgi:hypothetical protein
MKPRRPNVNDLCRLKKEFFRNAVYLHKTNALNNVVGTVDAKDVMLVIDISTWHGIELPTSAMKMLRVFIGDHVGWISEEHVQVL